MINFLEYSLVLSLLTITIFSSYGSFVVLAAIFMGGAINALRKKVA